MTSESSQSARVFAALIMLPLIVVAALVAFNMHRTSGQEDEARTIAQVLDRTLDRDRDGVRLGLAILPLRNDSGDAELDYLAVGIATDIRDQLADIEGLQLVGALSSANVAGQSLSLASMARLLGVRNLLHGSLRGEADDLELQLQLHVNDEDAAGAWRETWRSPANGLPNTTRAVAARVLESVLPGKTPPTPGSEREPSGEALDNYLRGKYLIDRYNRDDVISGIEYLRRAILVDAFFERAHWAKIMGHQRMTWIDAQATGEHEQLVHAAIDDWLALEVRSPLTYRIQALRAAQDNRYLDATAAFRQAVQLAPQQYAYDRGYMINLCMAGYLERCLEQAAGLARADPVSAAAHTGLANVYLLLGQNERMLEHAALAGRFGGDLGEYYIGIAQLDEEQWAQGGAALTRGFDQVGVASDWVAAYVAALADTALTDTAVAKMAQVDDASASWLDYFYTEFVALGRLDLAFEAAHRMVVERFETWNLYVWQDDMSAFRNDPRFIELMDAAGMLELWQTLGPPDVCVAEPAEPFCARLDVQASND